LPAPELRVTTDHRFRPALHLRQQVTRVLGGAGLRRRRSGLRRAWRAQQRGVAAQRPGGDAEGTQHFTCRSADLLRQRVQQVLDAHALFALARCLAFGALEQVEHRRGQVRGLRTPR
jgi:hypothetical protein